MWGKIIIPMYRLWLNGLYGLYGPRCPLFSKRPINLISLSLSFPDFNDFTGFILYMGPANERDSYIVMVSLIGWVHTQNDPCSSCLLCFFNNTRWIHFIFISSSNFQMCVECKAFCRIRKFEFLANFLNLWLWVCLVFTSDPIGVNNMGNRARHLFFPQLGSRTTIK